MWMASTTDSVGGAGGGWVGGVAVCLGSNRSIVVSREKSDNELLGVEEKSISVIVRDVLATLNTV